MNEPETTIVGNLTNDPELRFTASGRAVANFTIASTPRSFDKNKNEYIDGETMFLRCTVWNDYAENVAESLEKGMTVLAFGRLKSRTWEADDGSKRTNVEMDVNEVGPTLRFATARVRKHKTKDTTKTTGKTTTEDPKTNGFPDEPPF